MPSAAAPEQAAAPALSRLVWAISVPLLFAEVGEAVIHATDTALLSRVGTAELAAIALADILREVWVVAVVGLTEAAQIVIARRLGEGRERAIGATFTRGLLLALAIAVVLGAAMKLTAPALSEAVVASPEVARVLDDFLQVAAYGLPLLAVNLMFSALLVGVGQARALVGATVVLTATNFALSWVLIFGKLGAPELGIEGAAWGFVGAEAATLAYLTVSVLRRPSLRRYGLLRASDPGAPRARALMRLAAPVAIQGLVEALRWFAFFVILEQLSPEALAWSNLVYACFALLAIPAYAFGEAAYSLVSRSVGAGERDRIGAVVRSTIWRAAFVTVPFAAVMLVFPETVLSLFSDDQAAIEGSVDSLRVVVAGLLLMIPAEMWLAAVFGTGDTDAALGIEMVSTAAMLVVAWVAAFVVDAELAIVWVALAAASLVALPLSWLWIRSGYWERREI